METLAIVVNYNDKTNLLSCIESLHGQARIVVWDNASTDGSADAIRKKNFSDVIVHESPQNVLWTPALNLAIDTYLTDERYILLSNNDIRYSSTTIAQLANVLVDSTIGIVGPTGSGLGGPQDFASHHGTKTSSHNWAYYALRLPTIRVAYIAGASFMITSSIWQEIGHFDNTMPLGADDHDYCIRVKQAGYKIMLCQSAFIHHKSHASYPKFKAIWDKNLGPSWDAFNAKWAGYYVSEEEGAKCHWSGDYHPGWEIGTGWLSPAEKEPIYDNRRRLASVEEIPLV
jgi:O-antigen biosynthesis protein